MEDVGLFRSREEGRPRALWRLLFQMELFAVCSVVFGIPVVVLQLSAGTSEWLVFESGRGGESVELDLGRAMGSMVTEAPGLLVGSTAASLLAALVSVWVVGRRVELLPIRRLRFRGQRQRGHGGHVPREADERAGAVDGRCLRPGGRVT